MIDFSSTTFEVQDFVDLTPPSSGGDNVQYGYVTSKDGVRINGSNGVVINDNLVTHNGSNPAIIMSNIEGLADLIADNSWEIVTKVNNFKGANLVLGLYNTGISGTLYNQATYCNFQTSSKSNYRWAYEHIYTTSDNSNNVNHSLGETFNGYIKFERNKAEDKYILSYSITKETWTAINTYSFAGTTTRNQLVFVRLWDGTAGTANFDLKETYLTINGSKIWQAMK